MWFNEFNSEDDLPLPTLSELFSCVKKLRVTDKQSLKGFITLDKNNERMTILLKYKAQILKLKVRMILNINQETRRRRLFAVIF